MQALRDLTGNDELNGHGGRHVLPELGRAAELPTHVREALGHRRAAKVVSDSPADEEALERAISLARAKRSRSDAMATMANRYSSKDAAVVERENAAAACLLLARGVVQGQGSSLPASTREQIELVAQSVQQEKAAVQLAMRGWQPQ